MSYSAWKSGTAVLLTLGVGASTVAPIVMPAPVFAQASFPDVSSSYWAATFIQELVNRGIIAGFPDGSFRPEEPVTRAQFAAMLSKAFQKSAIRQPSSFNDVPSTYWAIQAIQEAYTTGFMAGFPDGSFKPELNIPRAQVLVALANGLNYTTTGSVETVLAFYNDASAIPNFARPSIAAATEKQLVVNYPDVKTLAPNEVATRAEVAAFIYQALVSQGQAAKIESPYIVGQQVTPPPPQAVRIPAGTSIPVRYEQAEKVLVPKTDPNPIPLTLKVAQNIVTANGDVLIPAGSDVVGELRVSEGAAQFFASEIVRPNGTRLSVNATSETISRTETVTRGSSIGRVLAGAAVGSGVAAGISAVTGDRKIQAWEVLTGTGVGALGGLFTGRDRVEFIAIEPNTDLALTLNSDLVIRQ